MSWDAEHPSLLLSVRLHSQLEQLLLVIFYVSYFTLLLHLLGHIAKIN